MFTEAFNARFMSLSTMKINVKVLAVAAFCAFSVAGQTASSPGTNVRSVPSFEVLHIDAAFTWPVRLEAAGVDNTATPYTLGWNTSDALPVLTTTNDRGVLTLSFTPGYNPAEIPVNEITIWTHQYSARRVSSSSNGDLDIVGAALDLLKFDVNLYAASTVDLHEIDTKIIDVHNDGGAQVTVNGHIWFFGYFSTSPRHALLLGNISLVDAELWSSGNLLIGSFQGHTRVRGIVYNTGKVFVSNADCEVRQYNSTYTGCKSSNIVEYYYNDKNSQLYYSPGQEIRIPDDMQQPAAATNG